MSRTEVEATYGAYRRGIKDRLSKLPATHHLEIFFGEEIDIKERDSTTKTVCDPNFFLILNAGKYTNDELDQIVEEQVNKKYS